MTKIRVTVSLDEDIEEWLRVGSRVTKKSISELIRICLRDYREQQPNKFSRADKARSQSEDAWKRTRRDVQKS